MAGFNATPLDGSTPPIPMSSAIAPGDATPHPVRGGPAVTDSNGNVLTDVATYTYDGDNVTMGLQADAAWSGSGAGSMIAILKKIVAGQTGTATIVNGATAGVPLVTESNLQTWLRNGQVFTYVSTGAGLTGPINSVAHSVFNPSASGKNILIFSIRVFINATTNVSVRNVTTNPALTAATAINNAFGNTTTSVATFTYSNAAQTPTGTQVDFFVVPGNSNVELLSNGREYLLVNGNAEGIVIYPSLPTGTITYSITVTGVEY